MIQIKFDKGRLKVGQYSLSNLAIAEALAAGTFFILTIFMGWSAWKDLRTYFAWNSALRDYASNLIPTADLDIAISNRKEFGPPHEMRAKIAVTAGDFPRAQQEYDALLKMDPTNEAAVVGQGILYVRQYDINKQASLLSAAKASFNLAPGSADAKVGLGHILLRQGELDGAYKQFESALGTDPPASIEAMTDLYIGLGSIAVKRKDPVVAREMFERALFLNPAWDRGYADTAYLIAQMMAETPAMEGGKFRAMDRTWTDIAIALGVRYGQDKEGRSYYKDAINTFYDAFACLAIRSLDLGVSATKLNSVGNYGRENRRPTLNYVASLASVVYNKTLTQDEQRRILVELDSAGHNAFLWHKDLTSRESAVVYELLAVRGALDGTDLTGAERNADLAKEQYAKGGEDLHLLAMIERVRGTAIWKQKQYERNEAQQTIIGERALKAFAESQKAEDQPDLALWLKKVGGAPPPPDHK